MDFTRATPDAINLGTGAISTTTNEFTITAWIRVSGLAVTGDVYTLFSASSGFFPYGGVEMCINQDDGAIGTWHSQVGFGAYVWSTKTVSNNVWAFVSIKGNAATGSGGNVYASLNGDAYTSFISSSTTSNMVPVAGENQLIGTWVWLISQYSFDGEIADVRYYDRQLSNSEISTMYMARGVDNIVYGVEGRWLTIQDRVNSSVVSSKYPIIGGMQNTGNSSSFSYAAVSGTNRILVVGVVCEWSGSDRVVTGITYGGQSLTLINAVTLAPTSNGRSDMYYLNEAGISAAIGDTIVISWDIEGPPNQSYGTTYMFLENVNQTTPVDSSATAVELTTSSTEISHVGFNPPADTFLFMNMMCRAGNTNLTAVNGGIVMQLEIDHGTLTQGSCTKITTVNSTYTVHTSNDQRMASVIAAFNINVVDNDSIDIGPDKVNSVSILGNPVVIETVLRH